MPLRPGPKILRLALIAVCLATAGCVSISSLEPFRYVSPQDHGTFAPVRLQINRHIKVPPFYYSRHQVVEAELDHSGAFAAVGPDVESPYLLDMRLTRHAAESAGVSASQFMSAVTLFLIPSKVRNLNRLEVDFYVGGRHVRRYEYSGAYEETLSLYNYSQLREGGDEFLSIRNMVNHLLRDLDRDEVLPRMGAEPAPGGEATDEISI